MTTRVLWAERARRDLLEIGDFIGRDKRGAASKLVGEILNAVERAAHFPSSGRIVPELNRPDIREILLGNYRIVYRLNDGRITILTVFEGHRLIEEDLP